MPERIRSIGRWINKYLWVIADIVVIIIGTYQYFLYYAKENSSADTYKLVLESLYSAVRLFSIESDISSINDVTIMFQFVRWLAVLAAGLTLIKAVELAFYQKFGRWSMLIFGNHYIICGLNEFSFSLIGELQAKREKVIVIEQDENNPFVKQLLEKNVLVIIGDAASKQILNKAGLKKSKGLIIYDTEDAVNVEVAICANDILSSSEKDTVAGIAGKLIKHLKEKQLKCYIHIVNKEYEKVFEQVFSRKNQISAKKLDIRFFNIYQNSARALFERHPVYEGISMEDLWDEHGKAPHLLVIGLGYMGQNVVLQAARLGHFPYEKQVKITVIDKDIKSKKEVFLLNYPYIDKACQIDYAEYDIRKKDFYDEYLGKTDEYDYVINCIDNDQMTFISSIHIINRYRKVPIAIRMSGNNNLSGWIEDNREDFKNVFTFGNISELSGIKSIIDEKINELAKAIHDNYNDGLKDGEVKHQWNELDIFSKSSNYAQADHIRTILDLVGLTIKAEDELQDGDHVIKSFKEFLSIIEPRLEELSSIEHSRWMAFHFIEGWTVQEKSLSKDIVRKKHPCLVTWAELDEVSKAHGKDYKEYDTRNIVEIYRHIERVGGIIVINKKEG
jgi:hypothetical protein